VSGENWGSAPRNWLSVVPESPIPASPIPCTLYPISYPLLHIPVRWQRQRMQASGADGFGSGQTAGIHWEARQLGLPRTAQDLPECPPAPAVNLYTCAQVGNLLTLLLCCRASSTWHMANRFSRPPTPSASVEDVDADVDADVDVACVTRLA